MKNLSPFFSFILLLIPLFLVGSCGMPQSKTTLKISSSMAVTNYTYSGGLVFYGRSSGGKFFSVPVAYQAGSGQNQAEIILDKGDWTFAAVGWNGPNILEGTSKCAVSNVKISSDTQTVELDLESSNCTHSEFGGNFDNEPSILGFGKFELYTCGAFYTNLSPLTVLGTSNNSTYCSTGSDITPDLKIWAKSARIRVPAIRPGLPPLPNSDLNFCINNLVQGIMTTPPSIRVPARGVPFIIELFNGLGCTDSIQTYEMREGLNFDYPTFDKRFYPGSPTIPASPPSTLTMPEIPAKLHLLATISKRGTSPLMASLPDFTCQGTDPCIRIPELPTYDRIIKKGQSFYLRDTNTNFKCDNYKEIYNSSQSPYTFEKVSYPAYDCEEKNGKIFFTLKDSFLSDLNCTSSCNLDFKFYNGSTYNETLNLLVENTATPTIDTFNMIFETIGHQDIRTTPPSGNLLKGIRSLKVFNEDSERENRHFGVLSKIREFFQPGTIGGLLSQYNSSTMLGTSTNISFWDGGIQRSYRIEVQADNSTDVPNYLEDDDAPNPATNQNDKFTHVMTVSKILGGAFIPEIKLRWIFGKQIGVLENKELEVKDGRESLRRTLIFWNTHDPNYGRFEVYSYDREVTASNPSDVLSQRTSYMRAERDPATVGGISEGNALIQTYWYDSEKNIPSGVYDQRSGKSGVALKNNRAIYFHSSVEAPKASGDPNFFDRAELRPYIKSLSLTPKTSTATSPDGNHLISSWAEFSGTYWTIKILRKQSGAAPIVYSYTPATYSNQPEPKVAINNDGKATVAFTVGNTAPYLLYAMTWNGNNWIYFNGDVFNGFTTPANQTATVDLSTNLIASLDPMSASAEPIKFDLIDESPSTNNSDKRIIFSHKPLSGNRQLRQSRCYLTSTPAWVWTTPSEFDNNEANDGPISHLSLVKVDNTNYHVAWVYDNSGYKLKTLKTILSNNSPLDVEIENLSLAAGINVNRLSSRFNDTNETLHYVYTSDQKIIPLTYNSPLSSSSSLVSSTTISDVKWNDQFPYCFQRQRTAASSFQATPETTSCFLPSTSQANAIVDTKSVNHDNNNSTPNIDVGFKHNIESLNPATFKFLFTMP